VGIISDRDLLRQAPEVTATGQPSRAAQQKLADIMTRRVVSASPTTNVRDVARLMLDERIHAVPILDAHRRLAGILTTRDLLRGIANHGPLELWT
jgi:acetoin utilization protein AcuB